MAIIRNFRLPEGIGVSADYIETFGVIQSTSPNTGAVVSRGGVGIGNSISIGGRLQLFNGNYFAAFDFAGSASTVYILPSSSPATGSSVLQSTSAGVMSWVPMTATSGAASGFTTLNGLTAGVQFFATGTSGSGFNISSSGSTHTFNIPIAGSGSTGLITTLAQTIAGQKTFTSAILGDLTGTATTATYANQSGYAITSGSASFANTATYAHQSGYATTSGSSTFATNASIAATAQNINVVSAFTSASHPILFTPTSGNASGVAVSSNSTLVYNPSTDILSVSGLAVTATTASTNSTSGSLIVSGGVGIGGSVSVGGRLQLFNGVNFTAFVSSASGNTVYTLPATSPATGSSVLQSTSAGVLSWVPMTATSGGSGTTSANVNVNSASTNSSHFLIFSLTATGSGVALSSESALVYNPSTDILSVSGLAVTSTTASTSTSNGSLQVAGGVGISGRLNFNQASFGTTGIATNPTMAMIGNTGDPIYMTILEDNSISFEGTQGQLFSITPNLSTGYIYSVNDITGIPLIRANANANVTANEYAGNFGIGLTNPGYRLHVLGSVGFTSTTSSTSTTTGTLIVGGGVGIGGSLYVASATAISGVSINNGIITGNLTGTATTSGFATTSNYSNQSGYGITAGLATTATYSHQAGYAVTSGSSNTSGYATTAGLAITATNINVIVASTNASHSVLFTPTSGSASGIAVSSNGRIVYNPSTDILTVSGLAVTAGTSSTSSSTGSLIVSGGVGIGGTLFVGTTIGVNSGTSGLLLQKLVGGNYGAIYSSGVTPSATNYTMITDGAAVNFNGTSGVYFNVSNTNKIQVTANNINIVPTAASTSTSTGAFTVAGGVGIGGSLYVSSATAISGVTINNGVIVGSLTGTATTSTYSQQSGYGITSGLATTSTYSHQSGYGITAGSSGIANTATYSHQSGYGLTSGFATTASYSYQSGYGITSGLATTSTYSHQSGYGITAGLATTAQTLNTVAASTNATHYVLFSPVNGGSGVAVSSDSGLTFNPSSNTVSLSTLAATTVSTSTASITGSTASTSSTTGALVVTGGVGIGGSLYVAGDLTINGTTTTINTVTLTVDDKNIELGSVSTPSDVTAEGGGITLKGTTDKSLSWYTGTGWSSSESWNLASGSTYKINNSTVLSNSSLGTGVTNSSLTAVGTISTGVWSGTLITALYGGTGFNSYTKGDLLVGAGTTLIKHAVGSQNQILIADLFSGSGLSWATFANPTYGSFYSTSTQQVAGAGVSTPVNFNATYESNRVSIFGGAGTSSRIQIQDAGPYSITFSAQINLVSGTQAQVGDFWFRVNGQDIPQSNSAMSISGKDYETLLTVNLVYTFANNDYFEIIMSSLDTQFSIEYQSGLTNPPRPNTPSIILSVLPITHIVGASGSGISGILSLNGSTVSQQYFLTGTSGSNFNVSTASGNHTFNIPIAGTGATGLLTSQNQTIGGLKTFASGISITASTASTSTTTGALTVTGGVGIGGSIFGGSTISAADNIEIRSAKELRLNNSGNTFYTGFKAGANTANAVYTFPTAYPGTGTSILQSDTSGVLTWVPLASVGNTIQNIVVNNAGNANVFHPILFTPSSLSAGSAVSSDTTITFNSSTDILNVSGLAVTSGTASTNTTTGALVVRGGLGVTGQLSFASASFGFTGIATNPTMSFIGATTSSPITLTVLTDNSLNFEGSQGSVFSIDNNLSSGEIFSVSDISGLPIISASAGQTVNINEFGGYTQIGNGSLNSSSTSSGSLVIAGGLGVTGNAYIGGTTNITNTSNSSSTTSGALVVNGGVGITGNANIGGTVRLTNTTASTSSSSGALTVSGGAGIAQTLFVGGNISSTNYLYSGGNNFTKSGQAQGDIFLDNNTNDTPGLLYYYRNNTNFGIDVYAVGIGATRLRIVRDLNESTGSEIWSIDRTGVVTRSAWDVGEVINTRVYNNSDLGMSATTTINSTTYTNVATITYTPKSSTSHLWIEFDANYDYSNGTTTDDFFSRITVAGSVISEKNQIFVGAVGGGTRSGVIFPISGRYTNSSTSGIAITVQAKWGSADDALRVYGSSTSGYMRIQEIGR